VVIALLVALVYNYSDWTLLILAFGYALSGPTARLYHFAHHRRRAPEEIHLNDPVKNH
jgi:hypothetical protein